MPEPQEQQKAPIVNASCKRCRQSKLKCIRTKDDEPCTRCLSSGNECVDVQRAIRRRKTRTDARVAHLENELQKVKDLLSNATEPTSPAIDLAAQRRFIFQEPLTPISQASGSNGTRALAPSKGDSIVGKTPPSATPQHGEQTSTWTLPGIVPDLVPVQQARRHLSGFRQRTVDQMPIVQLREHDTLESLSKSRPILLLAMITAASNAGDPALFRQLHSELIKRLAQKAVIEGERSIELVQAILVTETWLWVPDNFENVNFYQWIHIAATMALQLGLGGSNKGLARSRREEPEATANMEELRTTLVVYLSASSVASSLRRDNMFGLTPAVRVALDEFGKRAETTKDKRLLAWVRLEMIAEDIQSVTPNQQHSRESFLAMSSDVAANVYRLHIRLESWKQELQAGIMNELLFIHFQYCKAKLYEIPVHFHHDLSKLVAYPFTGGDAETTETTANSSGNNAILLRAVQPYHDACQGVLHAVLAITPEALGGCPTVLLARAVYAMNDLKIGQLHGILTEDVRSIHSLVASHLAKAVGEHGRQVPKAFLHVWKGLLPAEREAPRNNNDNETERHDASAVKAEGAYGTPCSHSTVVPSNVASDQAATESEAMIDVDTTFQLDQSTGMVDEMILDSDMFSDTWLTEYDPALDELIADLEAGNLPKCPWQQWQDAINDGQISSID